MSTITICGAKLAIGLYNYMWCKTCHRFVRVQTICYTEGKKDIMKVYAKCPKCGKMLKDEIYTSIEGEK